MNFRDHVSLLDDMFSKAFQVGEFVVDEFLSVSRFIKFAVFS